MEEKNKKTVGAKDMRRRIRKEDTGFEKVIKVDFGDKSAYLGNVFPNVSRGELKDKLKDEINKLFDKISSSVKAENLVLKREIAELKVENGKLKARLKALGFKE